MNLRSTESSPQIGTLEETIKEMCQVTPLMLACWYNATNSALLLLSLGADPNIVPRLTDGSVVLSPLCLAAWNNNPAVCRSLLASGAKQDYAGST